MTATPTATPAAAAEQRRQRRIGALSAAARRKSETKVKAAEEAIKRLVRNGATVTFQAVQREAGVSHSFLYGHPVLRRRIEQLRRRSLPPRAAAGEVTDGSESVDNVVLALTAQITRLKAAHRQEVSELRRALEQAYGENLMLRRELSYRGWSGPVPDS